LDVSALRVWRLRKLHQAVDAELHTIGEEFEIRFLFNGEMSYAQRCATRELALEAAAKKRAELEREGWAFHW
jgi:hypothetical protein